MLSIRKLLFIKRESHQYFQKALSEADNFHQFGTDNLTESDLYNNSCISNSPILTVQELQEINNQLQFQKDKTETSLRLCGIEADKSVEQHQTEIKTHTEEKISLHENNMPL